ncbi:MAG: methyltransferase domain-containing protein [Dehalococcoidia bacterium]
MKSDGSRGGAQSPDVLLDSLVERLKAGGSLTTPVVEAAFRQIPRHLFLPGVPFERVYNDEAIPTKLQDGIPISSSSQPAIMAIMLEQLDLRPGQRVLEIGAGTGYNAALMAQIVGESGHLTTVDIDQDIVDGARAQLAAAGLNHVSVVCADGGLGYPSGAPYDRIILTVGAWDIAPAWFEQLAPSGRLVLPLDLRGVQKSVAFERVDGSLQSVSVKDCGFMRLRGTFAGPESYYRIAAAPGLWLRCDRSEAADPEFVHRLLTGPWHATDAHV